MFFWCFQMLLTNSYILYKKYMLLHNITPMSHYDFQILLLKLRLDLIYIGRIQVEKYLEEGNEIREAVQVWRLLLEIV